MTPVSIVILTYERLEAVKRLLGELTSIADPSLEIIVVDNGSSQPIAPRIASSFPTVTVVALRRNFGVAGRNRGIEKARGEIVVTLDDDMIEFGPDDLSTVREAFAADDRLAALCFRITWPGTDRVRDWVHRPPVECAGSTFPTYEITEGAVAWRASALAQVGLYREDFFISHEGLDLSLRLLENGWSVIYHGRVQVAHAHDTGGRKSWRRYYFDTRNLFWIATLHFPLSYAMRYLGIGSAAMLVYSLRDGFLTTWFRAVRDGIRGIRILRRERRPLSPRTLAYLRTCDASRPSFWSLAWRRWRQRGFSME